MCGDDPGSGCGQAQPMCPWPSLQPPSGRGDQSASAVLTLHLPMVSGVMFAQGHSDHPCVLSPIETTERPHAWAEVTAVHCTRMSLRGLVWKPGKLGQQEGSQITSYAETGRPPLTQSADMRLWNPITNMTMVTPEDSYVSLLAIMASALSNHGRIFLPAVDGHRKQ